MDRDAHVASLAHGIVRAHVAVAENAFAEGSCDAVDSLALALAYSTAPPVVALVGEMLAEPRVGSAYE